jgi:type IV pilus assembly protein PilW
MLKHRRMEKSQSTGASNKLHRNGFTLVELLISMALGLFMTAAVVQSYLMTKRTYQLTQQVSRVQENSRFALRFLNKAIRTAGNRGCVDEIRSMLNDTTLFNFGEVIIGWDYNGTNGGDTYTMLADLDPTLAAQSSWTKAATSSNLPSVFANKVVPGSDVFVVQGMSVKADIVLKDTNLITSASLNVESAHQVDNGQVLLVTDCSNSSADLFQHHNNGNASNLNASSTNSYVPGNKNLASNKWSKNWGSDSYIFQVETAAYFVGYNVDDIPALYRAELGSGTDPVLISPVELVEGVETMQVLYGEDRDDDQVANRYVSANQVGDWEDIVSVRLSLLMRSLSSGADFDRSDNFTLAESVVINPQDDQFLRYVASSTVKLRNKTVGSKIATCEAMTTTGAEACEL